MFEKASRIKLHFDTPIGMLFVSDLWDLPLTSASKTNLDDIARNLHAKLKNSEDVSFVIKERKSDETVQLAFDIVKHIIDVKLAERDAAATEAENRQKKQEIMALIAQKKRDQLGETPLEELEKMVQSL